MQLISHSTHTHLHSRTPSPLKNINQEHHFRSFHQPSTKMLISPSFQLQIEQTKSLWLHLEVLYTLKPLHVNKNHISAPKLSQHHFCDLSVFGNFEQDSSGKPSNSFPFLFTHFLKVYVPFYSSFNYVLVEENSHANDFLVVFAHLEEIPKSTQLRRLQTWPKLQN